MMHLLVAVYLIWLTCKITRAIWRKVTYRDPMAGRLVHRNELANWRSQ
jgi:hypothetical protein